MSQLLQLLDVHMSNDFSLIITENKKSSKLNSEPLFVGKQTAQMKIC